LVNAGEDVSSADYVALLTDIPALAPHITALTGGDTTPEIVASAVEFVL